MTRTILRLLAGAVAVVAVTAACSGVPASRAPTGSDAQPQRGQTQRGQPQGGNDPRPAKATIVTGLASFYEREQKLPSDKALRFAGCMVDNLYDRASTRTLLALQAGNPKDFEPLDTGLIAKSGLDCQSALG